MIKTYAIVVTLMVLAACGLKGELKRPSDSKPDDTKQEKPTQGGYGLL